MRVLRAGGKSVGITEEEYGWVVGFFKAVNFYHCNFCDKYDPCPNCVFATWDAEDGGCIVFLTQLLSIDYSTAQSLVHFTLDGQESKRLKKAGLKKILQAVNVEEKEAK